MSHKSCRTVIEFQHDRSCVVFFLVHNLISWRRWQYNLFFLFLSLFSVRTSPCAIQCNQDASFQGQDDFGVCKSCEEWWELFSLFDISTSNCFSVVVNIVLFFEPKNVGILLWNLLTTRQVFRRTFYERWKELGTGAVRQILHFDELVFWMSFSPWLSPCA